MATERTPEEPAALVFDSSLSDRPSLPPLPSLEGNTAADTDNSTDILHERHSISSVNDEYSSNIMLFLSQIAMVLGLTRLMMWVPRTSVRRKRARPQ